MANEIKGFYDRDDQKHDIVTLEQLDAAAAERVSAIKEADIEVVLDSSDVSSVSCMVDNESVELDAFDNYTDKVRLVNVMIVGDDDEVILNRLGYYLSRSRKIAGNKQQRTQIIASGEYMISRTGMFGPQTPGWGEWSYLPSKTDAIASDNYLPVTSAAVYEALAGKANISDLANKFENIVDEGIVFDVSSNALVLNSDTTIYAPLFRDAIYTFPVEIGVYDSDNDVYIPFIGFCRTNYDADNGVYHSKVFIGERVLVLSKVAATGVTTLDSTYTLGSLLS